jgi:DNA-binding response OmpR family regulator
MKPGAAGNRVILAENDALMRGIIRAILLRAEQVVFPAGDGQEAVMLAQQFRARLVMLDIDMPRLNGLEACEAIRALSLYTDVPIVILTGHCDERMRLAAERVGATAFITKPFRPNVLLSQLAAYIDVPAHVLPPGSANQDTVLPGTRAQVWKTQRDVAPKVVEHPQLINGAEMMRIYRKAERTE